MSLKLFIAIFYLFTKFLYSLFFFQLANQKLSVLLGYDVAIQALNHDLGFISCVDYAVLTIEQIDIGANY